MGRGAVCKGPNGFNWGGTIICVAKGSDNKSLAKDILLKVCCDQKYMKKITSRSTPYVEFLNNKKVMAELAKNGEGNEFLGGQNPVGVFDEIQKSLDGSNTTAYDTGLNELFQRAMGEYIRSNVDEKKRLQELLRHGQGKIPQPQKVILHSKAL